MGDGSKDRERRYLRRWKLLSEACPSSPRISASLHPRLRACALVLGSLAWRSYSLLSEGTLRRRTSSHIITHGIAWRIREPTITTLSSDGGQAPGPATARAPPRTSRKKWNSRDAISTQMAPTFIGQ